MTENTAAAAAAARHLKDSPHHPSRRETNRKKKSYISHSKFAVIVNQATMRSYIPSNWLVAEILHLSVVIQALYNHSEIRPELQILSNPNT